jgi:hypothetical protein
METWDGIAAYAGVSMVAVVPIAGAAIIGEGIYYGINGKFWMP